MKYTTSAATLAQRRAAVVTRKRKREKLNEVTGELELVPVNDQGRIVSAEKLFSSGFGNLLSEEDKGELGDVYKRAFVSTLKSPLIELARKRAELECLILVQRKKDALEGEVLSPLVLKATELVLKAAKTQSDIETARERKKSRGGWKDAYASAEELDGDEISFSVGDDGVVAKGEEVCDDGIVDKGEKEEGEVVDNSEEVVVSNKEKFVDDSKGCFKKRLINPKNII